MTGILDERIEHAIRDSFSRQGLMTTMSAGIDEIAPGRVTLSLPIGPAVSQQHGFAHAGREFRPRGQCGGLRRPDAHGSGQRGADRRDEDQPHGTGRRDAH